MPRYVDGFVIPMPRKNVATYRRIATMASKVWRDHGALEYRECVADDLESPMGTSFKKLLKLKPTETAVFAYIVFRSRADRDRVNKKVLADPAMSQHEQEMPFEMKRMSYGGFAGLVEG